MQAIRSASKREKSTDINDHYAIGKIIGKGTFAAVHLCTRKVDGKDFAVKVFDKTAMSAKEAVSLKSEIDILRKVEHPNIVRLHETYDTDSHYYLVMECMHGGELFDRIVQKLSFKETDAALVVASILRALHHCHLLGIVHRDLKPENLLYATTADDSPVKIADFGLAKLQSHASESMKTACGTPGYVAPEVLMRRGYSKAVDLWSTGVITYILLCGFPPFYEENNAALFSAIKAAAFDYPPEFWGMVSDEAKDFIDHLLVKDPKARLTTEQALKHPWIVHHVKPADRCLILPETSAGAPGAAGRHPLQAAKGESGTLESVAETGEGGDGEGGDSDGGDGDGKAGSAAGGGSVPAAGADGEGGDAAIATAAAAAAAVTEEDEEDGQVDPATEQNLATVTELKKYNGIRKLRAGVQRVVIMHRLKREKTKLANLAKKVVAEEPEFL